MTTMRGQRAAGLALFIAQVVAAGACDATSSTTASKSPRPLYSGASDPEPIQSLPVHVRAPAGQLTLYADFEHRRDNGVVLYLVNRTDRNVAFKAQDSDPYIKLQAKTDAGAFERAQSHRSAWCGNSYFFSPLLKRGEFTRLLGYQPKEGKLRTVRYRIYCDEAYDVVDGQSGDSLLFHREKFKKIPLQLVSNVGQARAADDDIRLARYDILAVGFGEFEAVRDMATGRVKPSIPYNTWSRSDAVSALERFPTDESADLLSSMLTDEEVREAAVESLAKLGVRNAKAEAQFQRLLNGDDIKNRACAIVSLASRPVSTETVAFGQARLKESDPRIRMAAISLLMLLGTKYPEAKQAVLEHDNDPDATVREMVEIICKQWRRARRG